MKHKLLFYPFAVASLLIYAQNSFAQDTRHVSTTGNNTDNNCLNIDSPCGTIAHAISVTNDNDIVSIAPGTYAQPTSLMINRPLTITAADPENKPTLTTSVERTITVNASDVTIANLNFNLGLTTTTGRTGIYSVTNFNNLTIQGNRFASTANGIIIALLNYEWDAIAIHLEGPSASAYQVNITDNEVPGITGKKLFGRAIMLGNGATQKNTPGGIIASNIFHGFYGFQAMRTSADLLVENNSIFGLTMFTNTVGTKTVTLQNNILNAASLMGAQYHYAVLEIRSFRAGTIKVENNQLLNYKNIGILSSSNVNVSVKGNTFQPASDATDFVSIAVNTKYLTNGTQNENFSNAITILGNTFRAGAINQGMAINFGNHYTNANPPFENVIIGGADAIDKNTFEPNLKFYVVLDDQSGPSTSFPLWSQYTNTTMSPVTMNIEALHVNNNYNVNTRTTVESKMYDIADNTAVGDIIIGEMGANHYVATTGVDTDNDCTDSETPCLTITHALNVALETDTIFVATGNYALDQTLAVNQTGLTIMNWTANEQPTLTTNQARVIDVQAPQVTIEGLRIELGGTTTSGTVGLTSTNRNYNGLTVKNNTIVSTSPATFYGMVWTAHAIELASNELTDSVEISNNVIGVATEGQNNIFGRGIYLGAGNVNGAKAKIFNNEIVAYYTVQLIGTTGNTTVNNNVLNGITMINSPKANVHIDFTNNDLSAITPMGAESLYALADIRAIELGLVNFAANRLTDYKNIGVLSMASKNVSLIDNELTPHATANNFISTMVNTKLMTAGTQGTTYPNAIVLKGNQFNAGVTNQGQALVFADHYGVGEIAFENVVVGGEDTAEHNVFDNNLGVYIALDNNEGTTENIALWSTYSATTMRPVTDNITAFINHNTYNQPSRQEIENKNTDSLDIVGLGRIILGDSDLAINQIASMNIAISPNPTTQFLTINGDINTTLNLTVIDLLGNKIFSKSLTTGEKIDVSNLSIGAYLVELEENGIKKTIRFVKN